MPTTSLGITYPASTGHARIWEHIETAADDVNDILVNRTPLYGQGALSSLYTLTNTQTDLAGTSFTINVPTSNAVFFAKFKMAATLVTAGNITAVCQLLIDGVAQSPQAIWNPGNVVAGARGGDDNQLAGALSGSGNHTFKLQAARVFPAGTTGDIRLDNIHTCLSVLVFPY